MIHAGYKCNCCGWLGKGEEFGINDEGNSNEYNLETCPQCGSMDIIQALLPFI